MKPDGQGTDERLTTDKKRRQSASSVERDVMRLALIFTAIATLLLGAYYFSNRARMPDLSEDNPAMQQNF